MKLIDRTGTRYGHTVVLYRAANKSEKDTNARWFCLCDCGNTHIAYGNDLGKGMSSNCGCLRKGTKGVNRTHGMSRTRVYRIWCGMKTRCNNKKDPKYKWYGAKGIKVCDRWMEFKNFLSDMGDPEAHLTLDRIDGNKDYSPDNCQWATAEAQAANKKCVKKLTHDGITLNISAWARKLGISASTMHNRVTCEFPPEKLFATNLKHKSYKLRLGQNN